MRKSSSTGRSVGKAGKGPKTAVESQDKGRKEAARGKGESKASSRTSKPRDRGKVKIAPSHVGSPTEIVPIVVRHQQEVPEGLPKKYFLKSTFNTHDIMHAPVEKTLKMLDKILAGERLFTM